MDLETLRETPPWDWPRGTGKRLGAILRDRGADGGERLLAADLAGGGRRPAVMPAREGIAHLWLGALGPSGRRLALTLGRRPLDRHDPSSF